MSQLGGLLAVDGFAYRVLAGWVSLVRASVIWVLFSLPVVTAPAATLLLHQTVAATVRGDKPPTLADGWRMVRRELAPAGRLAALLVLGWTVTVSALLGPSPGGVWDRALPLLVIPVAVTWLLASQWCFAVLSELVDRHVDASDRRILARTVLRTSYLRTIRRPDLAALAALGTATLVVVGLVLPTAVWLPYWLTVPALCAWVSLATCRRAAPHVQHGVSHRRENS
ncbi:MAG TPA: hypothetical protein VIL34_02865 [Actinopolymorphaceae bacterium]